MSIGKNVHVTGLSKEPELVCCSHTDATPDAARDVSHVCRLHVVQKQISQRAVMNVHNTKVQSHKLLQVIKNKTHDPFKAHSPPPLTVIPPSSLSSYWSKSGPVDYPCPHCCIESKLSLSLRVMLGIRLMWSSTQLPTQRSISDRTAGSLAPESKRSFALSLQCMVHLVRRS